MPVTAGLRDAAAGAIGGAASLAMTYPLYSVVVKLQTDRKARRAAAPRQGRGEVRRAVRELYRGEGARAFVKGLSSALVAVFVQSGVYYYSYERFASVQGHSAKPLAHLFYGFEAAVVTTLLTNPFWVVNARQLTETEAAKTRRLSWWQALAVILKQEGLWGLWSGLLPALVLTANPAIQFFTAQWLAVLLLRRLGRGRITWRAFFVGGTSKMVSTVATYPIQTLRTCLQSSEDLETGSFRFTGPCQAALAIWRAEGLKGFFRGLDLKLVQTVLTAALLFSFRDNVRFLLDRYVGLRAPGHS